MAPFFPGKKCLAAALLLLSGASGDDEVVNMRESSEEEQAVTPSRTNALRLNAHIFDGNVLLKPTESPVENWIVSFCPSWWEPCQNLAVPFDQLGLEWESNLNTELLAKKVRFAAVDCATDKVLCNQQNVEQYPTVHHYVLGKRAATWVGGRASDPEKLAKWLRKRLSAPQGAPAAPAGKKAAPAKRASELLGDRAVDVGLVLFVLALNAWAVFSNPRLWQQSGAAKSETPAPAPAAEAAEARAEAERAAPEVRRVNRFLPEEWAAQPSSVEL